MALLDRLRQELNLAGKIGAARARRRTPPARPLPRAPIRGPVRAAIWLRRVPRRKAGTDLPPEEYTSHIDQPHGGRSGSHAPRNADRRGVEAAKGHPCSPTAARRRTTDARVGTARLRLEPVEHPHVVGAEAIDAHRSELLGDAPAR